MKKKKTRKRKRKKKETICHAITSNAHATRKKADDV
jgi:hypothetical protein